MSPNAVQDVDAVRVPSLATIASIAATGRTTSTGGVRVTVPAAIRAGGRTISGGSVDVSIVGAVVPGAVQDVDTLQSPTVVAGAATVAPASVQDVDTIQAPAVIRDQALAPAAVQDVDTIASSTVAAGAIALSPAAVADADTLQSPTVAPGAATVAAQSVQDAEAIEAPSIAPGAATVAPAAVADADTIQSPAVANAGGAGGITVGAVTPFERGATVHSSTSDSYDSGTGTDRMLQVVVWYLGGSAPTEARYNGVLMTEIRARNEFAGAAGVTAYELVAPATGSNILAVTFGAAVDGSLVTAQVLEGVNQTTPTEGDAPASLVVAAEITVDVTTSTADAVMFMASSLRGAAFGNDGVEFTSEIDGVVAGTELLDDFLESGGFDISSHLFHSDPVAPGTFTLESIATSANRRTGIGWAVVPA